MGHRILRTSVILRAPKRITVQPDPKELAKVLHEPTVTRALEPPEFRLTAMRDQIVVEASGDCLTITDYSGRTPAEAEFVSATERILKAVAASGSERYRSYGFRFVAELHDEHTHPIAVRIAQGTLAREALRTALEGEVLAAEVVLTTFDERARRYTLSLAPRGGSLGTHLLHADLWLHIEEPVHVPIDRDRLAEPLEQGHPRLDRWARGAAGLSWEG